MEPKGYSFVGLEEIQGISNSKGNLYNLLNKDSRDIIS